MRGSYAPKACTLAQFSASFCFLEMVLRRMKIENAIIHGFRSSFRDGAGNVTAFAREITETALAHVNDDKAEHDLQSPNPTTYLASISTKAGAFTNVPYCGKVVAERREPSL
jgi:hypothetical protein